ncbi:thiazole tautomerase TenI [Bacillus tianshenii]|uniref:thiazole tautomerase TenI n=1 Tax=Sutcliffiella tianshenii TaxID=1463404 RepID=UPI001CD51E60|nr:thiazole tautomerase TenI [Bacillus tianshenii]MCA1321247.1 thiazole tautomerase TenI [Bacillus tianshenii]
MKLHVITDGKRTADELVSILCSIHSQADHIHVREKNRSAKEIYQIVKRLIDGGIPPKKLIINDRMDVAHSLGVGGVQLAYHSLGVSEVRKSFPDLQIGKSVHSYQEAIQAEQDGASFLLYGHVYSTMSKEHLKPRGVEELKAIASAVSIPVIAIGGITLEKTSELKNIGVKGIAVMSGIMSAKDPWKAATLYQTSRRKAGSDERKL